LFYTEEIGYFLPLELFASTVGTTVVVFMGINPGYGAIGLAYPGIPTLAAF